jgi:hypothetical protein
LIELGESVARFDSEGTRLVVALALPTRAFAAAFIAASVVSTVFEAEVPATDPWEHFELLASLPPGAAINHHRGNSIEQGRLLGLDERFGERLIKFETRNMTRYLRPEMCSAIQVLADPGELRMTRRRLIRVPEFLARALPGVDAAALSATTRIDTLLVGPVDPLRHEIVTEQFAVGREADRCEGNLQTIIRARRFAGQNAPHRSEVVAAGGESVPAMAGQASPRVVIFDGASGFNNWRSRWRQANWIVLLDRSSPSTQAGADTINYGHSTRLSDSDALVGIDLPPSVEAVSYLERGS